MTAIILFAIAALGGIVLANLRLRGKALPTWLALVHGGVAAAGLIVLIVAAATSGLRARVPLALFIVAAIGGFVLFSFQLRHKIIPVALILVHAAIAVLAFVLLLLGAHGGA